MDTGHRRGAALPRPLRIAARWAASLGVLLAVSLALRGRVEVATGTGIPWPPPGAVLLTLLAFAAANETLVRAWLALVALGSARLPLAEGRWVWAKSQMARYAVAMAQVPSRALVAQRHGLRASTGAITTLLEVVWYACINGLMVVATIPWWLPGTGLGWAAWFAVLPGGVIVAALVAPSAFVDLAVLGARLPLLRRIGVLAGAADLTISRRQTGRLTLLYIANVTIRFGGFMSLYLGVGGPPDALPRVIGAFALGHLIGAVAVFAPGGLGPREGVTALVLAPVLGTAPVLLLVAATRVCEVVAELAFAGFARLRAGRGVRPDDPPPPERPPPADSPIEGQRLP